MSRYYWRNGTGKSEITLFLNCCNAIIQNKRIEERLGKIEQKIVSIEHRIYESTDLFTDLLKPLIQETANKIMTLSPNEAQTGPAKRRDTQTINSHLTFLTDENQKEIYKLLTKSIIDNGKKL